MQDLQMRDSSYSEIDLIISNDCVQDDDMHYLSQFFALSQHPSQPITEDSQKETLQATSDEIQVSL